jgi:branched-chain amino acid:cation transporter, LIVCS family
MKMTAISGGIAAMGLGLVYGGLMYLGSTVSVTSELSKTSLTVMISEMLFGKTGTWLLGIGVSAACLTTSIGFDCYYI